MSPKKKLDQNKRSVTTTILNAYIFTATIALLTNMIGMASMPFEGSLLYVSLNFFLLVILVWLRLFKVRTDYRVVVWFINAFLLMVITVLLLTDGTNSAHTYLLIIVSVLCTSIILGVKCGTYIATAYVFISSSIFMLNSLELITFMQGPEKLTVFDTVIDVSLLGFIVYIIHLGFSEIEASYNKAYSYAQKLENLNDSLDKKVQLRTEQLKESFNQQVSSLYSTATVGRIAKSMLHDIATPLSTLKGAYSLLQQTADPEERQSLLELSDKAVSQIGRIVSNSQSLIHNETPNEWFYPKKVVENALIITKHELRDLGITVTVKIDREARILGVTGIFERIVLNLVTNATDELKETNRKNKKIDIKGYTHDGTFVLEVIDNGRGISPENLTRIFEPDFTSKIDSGSNFGMGLHFVKTSMEKFFGGSVEAESTGKGTCFTLVFNPTGSETY